MSERDLIDRLDAAGPQVAEHARSAIAHLEVLHDWLLAQPPFDHRASFVYRVAADLKRLREVAKFYERAGADQEHDRLDRDPR